MDLKKDLGAGVSLEDLHVGEIGGVGADDEVDALHDLDLLEGHFLL